jgi:protease I
MKRTSILLSILFILASLQASAQDTELELIEQTLTSYLDGLSEKNDTLLKRAFQPDARMEFIYNDELQNVNALEALISDLTATDEVILSTRIVSVNISGNASSAQLEIQLAEITYIDFMNLLKIDGNWKIVNKVFFTRPNN